MSEHEKQDEELARAQSEGLKPAPPAEADAALGQPARRVLGQEATEVLREFAAEAKAKEMRLQKARAGLAGRSPTTP